MALPSPTRDVCAEEAFVTARTLDTLTLRDWRERLLVDIAEPGYADPETDAVARCLAESQLAEVDRELARRERVAMVDNRVSDPGECRFSAWVDVAQALRGDVPVPQALEWLNHLMQRVGRDRAGRAEYAGACPWCGGEDRFRAWDPPRSRYWCRQCGASGDVVQLWRQLVEPDFRRACEQLADLAQGGRP
jgi:hypothetical protein